jgi:hypothetical protein
VCVFFPVSDWLRLLPLLGILALLGYLTIRPFLPKKKKQKDSLINLKIQKENPKVVNEIDIEDLKRTNVCYCRCWRSKTVNWTRSRVEWLLLTLHLLSHFGTHIALLNKYSQSLSVGVLRINVARQIMNKTIWTGGT